MGKTPYSIIFLAQDYLGTHMLFLVHGMCIIFPAFVRFCIMFLGSAGLNHYTMAPDSHGNIFQATIAFHFSWTLPSLPIQSCFHADITTLLENRWRRPSVPWPTSRDLPLDSCFLTSFSSTNELCSCLIWSLIFKLSQIWPDVVFIGLQAKNFAGAISTIVSFCLEGIIIHVFLVKLTCYFISLPGFAFIYMDDERDAEDAIRALDRTEFGRHGRRLRVEWTTKVAGNK